MPGRILPDLPEEAFEQHRARLTGLAYRMLGSVAEAEDAVQDAWLRWRAVDTATVANVGGFLSTIVTRLCLDRLKSARRRRELYVGEWLPEPLVAQAGSVETSDDSVAGDISFALMLALERLSPLERAAFLLHDVFETGFDEIAVTLGRSEAACRQLASRARTHLRNERSRFPVAIEERDRVAEAFFAASRSGDTTTLRTLLAENAVLHSDGGGRKPATLNPIHGVDRICRLFAGLVRKAAIGSHAWARRVSVNGMPGWLTVEPDGTLQTTALEIAGDRIVAIYVTRNPDKLRHVAHLVPPARTTGAA